MQRKEQCGRVFAAPKVSILNCNNVNFLAAIMFVEHCCAIPCCDAWQKREMSANTSSKHSRTYDVVVYCRLRHCCLELMDKRSQSFVWRKHFHLEDRAIEPRLEMLVESVARRHHIERIKA